MSSYLPQSIADRVSVAVVATTIVGLIWLIAAVGGESVRSAESIAATHLAPRATVAHASSERAATRAKTHERRHSPPAARS